MRTDSATSAGRSHFGGRRPEGPPAATGRRLDWVDQAKAIGIALVVYGHVARGLAGAGTVAPQSPLWAVDYAIYTFHMPLFFLLSGMFAGRSLARGAAGFWRSKLLTIAYPYLLWSILQGSLMVTFSGATNGDLSWANVADILWRPISPFWFLYSLFLCHLLYALLHRLDHAWLLAVAAVPFVWSEIRFPDGHHGWLIADTAWGFLYYAIGVVLSARLRSPGAPVAWAPLAAAVFLAASLAGWRVDIPHEANVIAAAAGIGATVGVACLLASRTSPLRILGAHSMAIYVMHITFAAGTRILLQGVLGIEDLWVNVLAGVTMGLALPIAVHLVLIRLGLARLAGLPPEGRPPPSEPGDPARCEGRDGSRPRTRVGRSCN